MTKNNHFLNPVTKSRLHEEIVGQIEKKIIKGEIKIGSKLPSERELATTLQVNRATVREALKKLELLGLIKIHHGDGIYVQNYLESGNLEILKSIMYLDESININILKNILQIRRIIVPEMTALAAQNRDDNHVEQLNTLLHENSQAPLLQRDLKVHQIIARASKNIFYIFILNFFNQLFTDYGHMYFNNSANKDRTKNFHEEIFEAIKDKDAEKAKRIMSDILHYSEKEIHRVIEQSLTGSLTVNE